MIIYWILYIAFCISHLVICFFEKNISRKITKVFLMPLLMTGLFLEKIDNPLLILGLFFGWLGDVFLIITHKKRYFLVGGFFFLFGHVAYIILALTKLFSVYTFNTIPLIAYLALLISLIVIILVAVFLASKIFGKFAYLGIIYYFVLSIAITSAFLISSTYLAIGFIIFTLSDTFLILTRFKYKVKRDHFYIMTTYILAQSLISLSFIL